jgi:membrane protein YdbS with pleckstrin-like domain
MKCNQCGADLPAQAAFCPKCGAQISRAAAGAAVPAPASRMQPGGAAAAAANAPEEELWNGGYSPKAMTGAFVGAALICIVAAVLVGMFWPEGWIPLLAGAAVVFGYLGLVLLVRQMTVHYRLTSQRLLRQKGILSRVDDRILVVEIDDVSVRQGIFDRLFGVGTIVLVTKDETTPNLNMSGIENPRHVADLIDEARRAERSRRGLYMVNA